MSPVRPLSCRMFETGIELIGIKALFLFCENPSNMTQQFAYFLSKICCVSTRTMYKFPLEVPTTNAREFWHVPDNIGLGAWVCEGDLQVHILPRPEHAHAHREVIRPRQGGMKVACDDNNTWSIMPFVGQICQY